MIINATAFPKTTNNRQMRVIVLGAGAIGSLVAGYLKFKNEDVSLVGHPDAVKAVKEKGLEISGVRGSLKVKIEISEKLNFAPDFLILATKTQDIPQALEDNLKFLRHSLVLTVQNGIQADNLVAEYLPKENIISSIVMFGATYSEPAKVVHNFEGSWILGKFFAKNDEKTLTVSQILNQIFPAIVSEEIKGMKYLKIFLNANNCLPAILDLSMQEAFTDPGISKISIAIWREGLTVVEKSGIRLESLPDFPLERLIKLTHLPLKEAAKIFSCIMTNLSKEPLYGSILQSIRRGRSSEIDYLNGEFVSLARQNNFPAPLNERLVQMVHQLEKDKKFLSKEELIKKTGSFVKEE